MSVYNTDMINLEVDTWLDTIWKKKRLNCAVECSPEAREGMRPNSPGSLFNHMTLLGYQLINRLNFHPSTARRKRPCKKILRIWMDAFKKEETATQGKFLLREHVLWFLDISYFVNFSSWIIYPSILIKLCQAQTTWIGTKDFLSTYKLLSQEISSVIYYAILGKKKSFQLWKIFMLCSTDLENGWRDMEMIWVQDRVWLLSQGTLKEYVLVSGVSGVHVKGKQY